MGGNYRKRSRGNRGSFGGGRGRGRGKPNFNFKRTGDSYNSKSQWQTKDRLTEPEAGITKFVSDIQGFQGIIKSRYSDFHVNEIDMDGNQALLESFNLPEAPAEKCDDLVLKEFISDEQIQKIQELVDSAEDASVEPVVIDVTNYDKEKRAKLHRSLKSIHGRKVFNVTVTEEDKKFIHVKKATKTERQRALEWAWPHDFTCFVLHKENIDTLSAISALSHQLKMKPALFAYAGTKDKRAKTSQWISVRKLEPKRIFYAAKKCQGLRVGNFKFLPEALRLGNLEGNRFRIALRSVKGERDEIEKSLESLRDFGFINYYGLQRFGNCQKIPTYMIGKALLAGDFKEACNLILQERTGEPYYMQDMRKAYAETKSAAKALECLHSTNTCVEARILHGLVKHGDTNYLHALLNLPRNMLMLYTHAYQSFIFNQIASERREMGLEVIEGDLVFTENPPTELDVIDEANVDEEGQSAVEESSVDEEVESKFMTMVRPLTAEDVASKSFTIYDVVLPLPGFDIRYPTNEIGPTYVELLAKDDLTSEKLKGKQIVFSLTGAYRKVFVKPESFSWNFMKYQSPTADLILSDCSKIFNDPEPKDDPTGENLSLIIDFILPPSAYATMALREIMKCDTSVGNQIELESEIKKAADGENTKKRELESDETEESTESKKPKKCREAKTELIDDSIEGIISPPTKAGKPTDDDADVVMMSSSQR